MANNTLTGLIPVLYEGLQIVARELVGFIPAVTKNSEAEGAAVGEVITYPIAPPATTGDIVAGQFPTDDGAQTIGTGTMTISKSKYSPIRWAGEEQLGVKHTGQYNTILRDQFAQSLRALVNLVEVDLATAIRAGASRAFGTIGTAPFATAANFLDFANMLKILDDNGAPMSDRQLVLGSSAVLNLRGIQSNLFKANEAGTDELLRRGIVAQVEGFDIHQSNAIASAASGTGTNYTSTTAGFAIGTTSIPLITGSGTVLAGDTVTFTGDTNIYIVATGITAPGTIVLAGPGLRKALAASAVAMTVGAASSANAAFHRSAVQLVTRAPAMPDGGDLATDVITITDPISNISFQVATYEEYRRRRYEVGLSWGVKVNQPEFVATLLG